MQHWAVPKYFLLWSEQQLKIHPALDKRRLVMITLLFCPACWIYFMVILPVIHFGHDVGKFHWLCKCWSIGAFLCSLLNFLVLLMLTVYWQSTLNTGQRRMARKCIHAQFELQEMIIKITWIFVGHWLCLEMWIAFVLGIFAITVLLVLFPFNSI